MKVSVCIPDELMKEAGRLARRTKRSRSRLFTDALKEYLARHSSVDVIETRKKTWTEISDLRDPFVSIAALRTLERNEW